MRRSTGSSRTRTRRSRSCSPSTASSSTTSPTRLLQAETLDAPCRVRRRRRPDALGGAGGNRHRGTGMSFFGRTTVTRSAEPTAQVLQVGVVGRRPRDQPGAAAVRREAEHPADEHQDAVLEAHEVEEVDEEPGDPGEEAAELHYSQSGDRRRAPDRREVALVVVAERARVATANAVAHDPGGVAS